MFVLSVVMLTGTYAECQNKPLMLIFGVLSVVATWNGPRVNWIGVFKNEAAYFDTERIELFQYAT
jgi:hypothetical protein